MEKSPPIDANRRPVSEHARRREVTLHYQANPDTPDLVSYFEQNPDASLPSDFVAVPSKDASLTAFAQLGALRLDVTRSMISLIDGESQMILAEATRTLSLRADSRHGPSDKLWLGNAVIPRDRSTDERVLHVKDVVVISDLSQDENFPLRKLLQGSFTARFYAAVPIRSPTGAILGAYAVFHDEPRESITSEELVILQELAATVMDYLETYKLRKAQQHGEQMLRGLTSFMTGAAYLQAMTSESLRGSPTPASRELRRRKSSSSGEESVTPNLINTYDPQRSLSAGFSTSSDAAHQSDIGLPESTQSTPYPSSSEEPKKSHSPTLQESMLPLNSKEMFSRAANIIRETSNLDGVLMFDAAIASFRGSTRVLGNQDNSNAAATRRSSHVSATSDTSEKDANTSSHSDSPQSSDKSRNQSTSSRNSRKPISRAKKCEILAFANTDRSSLAGNIANKRYLEFAEDDLSKLLRKYPDGKIFNVHEDGYVSSEGSDGSGNATESNQGLTPTLGTAKAKSGPKTELATILEIAPQARSFVLLPLWDFQRERWFASCFMWTTDRHRILTNAELQYLRVFGNTIMMELSRLDAIDANRAKTTFMSSISHELRSPLHGILGGVEFLQDTSVDSFQTAMVSSIEMCGKTLLDTVDHILDFAKINKFTEFKSHRTMGKSSPGLKRNLSQGVSKHQLFGFDSLTTTVDLSLLVEEVVEATLAGQNYKMASFEFSPPSRTSAHSRQSSLQDINDVNINKDRRQVRVSLDISQRPSWKFTTQGGAWRRVLMNLFGNAVKYTDNGYIHIILQAEEADLDDKESTTKVCLRILDSGIGMSQDFMYNKLYTPFSQEDPFSTGTGLGLSIVRKVVKSLGGKIHFHSKQSCGTEVKVILNLDPPSNIFQRSPGGDPQEFLAEIAADLRDQRIGILEPFVPPGADIPDVTSPKGKGQSKMTSSLQNYMKDWFGATTFVLEAHNSGAVDGSDIVICTEPSFRFLASIRQERRKGRIPLVVFIAIDAMEAATLRGDSRVTSGESIVEIITQPCGPYKLAKCLHQCLHRAKISSPENLGKIELAKIQTEARPPDPQPAAMRPSEVALAKLADDSAPTSNKAVTLATRPPKTQEPTTLVQNVQFQHQLEPLQPETSQHALRILMVDDNRINLRLLSAFMKKHGFEYGEASNGLEALEAYQRAEGRFDYILMDLSMPVMDGMTSTREIRKYEQTVGLKPITIIALTGLASANARVEALSSGIDHFMTKPVKFQLLSQLLNSKETK